MKLNKKQISLGALAAVTVIAIPVATVISCGSDSKSTDTGNGAGAGNSGNNNTKGDGVKYFKADKKVKEFVRGINLMESVANPYSLFKSNAKTTTTFNYPQLNLFGAKKNNENVKNNKWKTIAKYRIYWDSRKAKEDSEGLKDEEFYAVETKEDFQKTLNKVNQDIKSKIDKLPELHKRTLVFANSDFTSGDSNEEFYLTKNSKFYFDLVIYDTLNGNKLSSDMEKSINSFVKKSNVCANTWNDWVKLDSKMKTPKNADGSTAKREDLLTRSFIRNQQVGMQDTFTSDNPISEKSFWIASNLFNGTIKEGSSKKKTFDSKEYDEYVKEIKTRKSVHLTTETYTDLTSNALKQRVTFSEGGKMALWKNGMAEYNGFKKDNVGTVFTINPTTIDFNSADDYILKNDDSIFENESELLKLIQDQFEIIIYGSAGKNINSNISTMKKILPGLSNLLTEVTPLVAKVETFKGKYGSLDKTSKAKLSEIIKKALPSIKKRMKNQVGYGRFLNSFSKFENSSTNILDLNWSPKEKLDGAKKGIMNVLGLHGYEFRTQSILYFAIKVLADFAPELTSNWN